MKTKKEHALEILQKKILSNPHFDRTNYDKNIETAEFIKIYINYDADFSKAKKLSHKSFVGKMATTNLKNHLKDVKAEYIAPAFYDIMKNTIVYNDGFSNKEMLLHEMVHMSTSNCLTNKSGFTILNKAQTDVKRRAFNEGFTQWLTAKTLYGNDEKNSTYAFETRIARMIEIATSEQQVLKHFSQANFKKFNQELTTNNSEFPLRNIEIFLDDIDYCNKLLSTYMAANISYNYKKKSIENILDAMDKELKALQKHIIDIFFMNEENINSEYKNIEFMDTLITHDVTNEAIFYLYEPILTYNFDALNYYKAQLKKHNKELYNGLFKTLTK